MKYIKKYQQITYHENDYLLLRTPTENTEWIEPYAKIIKKLNITSQYYVELFFPNTNHWKYSSLEKNHNTWINYFDIIRKLTNKEKKELKIKIASNKYNI